MIQYSTDTLLLENLDMNGFFVDWPNPPNIKNFKRILLGSYKCVIAFEENKLVGFINAISDGVLSAYIPLLEVLPEYQSKCIGKKLVEHMKEELSHLYMVDLLCDEKLVPYYEKLGMNKSQGVHIRNYDRQSAE
ncbi:GNAT family N-acetyltransferase [Halobacteriovorax marinus]|uniref:GNAT family N-acetyltransferase n=1 Tax=Halobacteriovorax marinus TaxID=97084 RepID=A0A1Y5F8Q2_9BACT|nr:GNAT family N-acetyltransferase [Halobacteriovorax marinus]